MHGHLLLNLLLKTDLLTVLHLHFVLLLIKHLNQLLSLHCLKVFVEILSGLVPYSEGIVQLGLTHFVSCHKSKLLVLLP